MTHFDDLLKELVFKLARWILHSFAKLFFVALIIGGWYLLQSGNFIVGFVVEMVGLAGLDLTPWVQRKLFKPENLEEKYG